jgi:hypothetical protein
MYLAANKGYSEHEDDDAKRDLNTRGVTSEWFTRTGSKSARKVRRRGRRRKSEGIAQGERWTRPLYEMCSGPTGSARA